MLAPTLLIAWVLLAPFLAGALSFWSLRVDDDGIDWDAFERGFRGYVKRVGRERLPAGRA